MKTGQISVEYLLVVAFGLTLLTVGGALIYFGVSDSQESVDGAIINSFGNSIVNEAGRVFRLGVGTRLGVTAALPRGITNISISSDKEKNIYELLFTGPYKSTGNEEFAFYSKVPINGTFRANDLGGGLKTVHLESYRNGSDSFVYMNFGGRCPASNTFDLDNSGGYDAFDSAQFCACKTGSVWDGKPAARERPNTEWKANWFDGAQCMLSDYDGNCNVDDIDQIEFESKTGLSAGC